MSGMKLVIIVQVFQGQQRNENKLLDVTTPMETFLTLVAVLR